MGVDVGPAATARLDARADAAAQAESDLVADICHARLQPGRDIDGLTELYRRIFYLLVTKAALAPGEDRAVEREIAAALESVFPRIGLKAFVGLELADKATQLREQCSLHDQRNLQLEQPQRSPQTQ